MSVLYQHPINHRGQTLHHALLLKEPYNSGRGFLPHNDRRDAPHSLRGYIHRYPYLLHIVPLGKSKPLKTPRR